VLNAAQDECLPITGKENFFGCLQIDTAELDLEESKCISKRDNFMFTELHETVKISASEDSFTDCEVYSSDAGKGCYRCEGEKILSGLKSTCVDSGSISDPNCDEFYSDKSVFGYKADGETDHQCYLCSLGYDKDEDNLCQAIGPEEISYCETYDPEDTEVCTACVAADEISYYHLNTADECDRFPLERKKEFVYCERTNAGVCDSCVSADYEKSPENEDICLLKGCSSFEYQNVSDEMTPVCLTCKFDSENLLILNPEEGACQEVDNPLYSMCSEVVIVEDKFDCRSCLYQEEYPESIELSVLVDVNYCQVLNCLTFESNTNQRSCQECDEVEGKHLVLHEDFHICVEVELDSEKVRCTAVDVDDACTACKEGFTLDSGECVVPHCEIYSSD
jgi:hypothetical protein